MRRIIFLTFPILLAACGADKGYEICSAADCTSPNTTVVVE